MGSERARRALEDGPALPDEAAYLWGWYCELAAARNSNGFGPVPLSFAEIDAWARLNARVLHPFELRALRALDAAWLAPGD